MFSIANKNMVIDGYVWIFHFDPLATSVLEFEPPKQYIYKGYYSSTHDDGYMLFISDNLKLNLVAIRDYDYTNTGNYIVAPTRHKIISKLQKIASRKLADLSYNLKASEYIRHLAKTNPEWVI